MRIGILTFHRAHNYGAVLQCYALQQILVRRGHDVRIIDYRQPWIEDQYKLFSLNMMRRNAGSISELAAYLSKTLKKFLISPLRGLYFRRFREEFLLPFALQYGLPAETVIAFAVIFRCIIKRKQPCGPTIWYHWSRCRMRSIEYSDTMRLYVTAHHRN